MYTCHKCISCFLGQCLLQQCFNVFYSSVLAMFSAASSSAMSFAALLQRHFCNTIFVALKFCNSTLLHFDVATILSCVLLQHLVPNHLTIPLLQNQTTTMTFPPKSNYNNDYIHAQVLVLLLAMLKFQLQQCSCPRTNYNDNVEW